MDATNWPDNSLTHLATAMITGIVSTTATNPVDVIKTYMFVGKLAPGGDSQSRACLLAGTMYKAGSLQNHCLLVGVCKP